MASKKKDSTTSTPSTPDVVMSPGNSGTAPSSDDPAHPFTSGAMDRGSLGEALKALGRKLSPDAGVPGDGTIKNAASDIGSFLDSNSINDAIKGKGTLGALVDKVNSERAKVGYNQYGGQNNLPTMGAAQGPPQPTSGVGSEAAAAAKKALPAQDYGFDPLSLGKLYNQIMQPAINANNKAFNGEISSFNTEEQSALQGASPQVKAAIEATEPGIESAQALLQKATNQNVVSGTGLDTLISALTSASNNAKLAQYENYYGSTNPDNTSSTGNLADIAAGYGLSTAGTSSTSATTPVASQIAAQTSASQQAIANALASNS